MMISRVLQVQFVSSILVDIVIVPTGCIRVSGISIQRPSPLLCSENMVQRRTIAIITAVIFAWEVCGRGCTYQDILVDVSCPKSHGSELCRCSVEKQQCKIDF